MSNIYESPDNGKTVYERNFNSTERNLIKQPPKYNYMWGKEIGDELAKRDTQDC
jgi:hypothetical protein